MTKGLEVSNTFPLDGATPPRPRQAAPETNVNWRLAGSHSHFSTPSDLFTGSIPCFQTNVKPKRNPPSKEHKKPQSYRSSRVSFGGRYRTRTCDPLHVNPKMRFFVIIFDCFCLFPFQNGYFSTLSKGGLSTVSGSVCGCSCGQTTTRPSGPSDWNPPA